MTISEKTWQKLSSADREAVTKAARETAAWIRKEIRANDERQLADMTAKGAKVARPPLEPFRKSVQPAYAKAKEKYGADVDQVLAEAERIRKAMPVK
jgi:TRAP-type C4-dicarboxylate transport system substrate-binding protein